MKDICECIKYPKDKELLLISLDENKRNEEKEIIKLREQEEDILRSRIIDMNKINKLEYFASLHKERIEEINALISKVENTKIC